jgi:hypothetical protein
VISGSFWDDDGPAMFKGKSTRRSKSEEGRAVLKRLTNEGAGLDSLDASGSLSALGRVGVGVDNHSSKVGLTTPFSLLHIALGSVGGG